MSIININENKYKVTNSIDIIRAFWVFDSSFLEYDLEEKIDYSLEDDASIEKLIKVSRRIGTRASTKTLKESLSGKNRRDIKECIDNIQTVENINHYGHLELVAIKDYAKWNEIKCNMVKAIRFMIRTENSGIKVSTATKILHKLRPGIFPILDVERIQKLYNQKLDNLKDIEKNLDKFLDIIWQNMNDSTALLNYIHDNIPNDVKLTRTRIFDILLWAKSSEDEIFNFRKKYDKSIPYYFFK